MWVYVGVCGCGSVARTMWAICGCMWGWLGDVNHVCAYVGACGRLDGVNHAGAYADVCGARWCEPTQNVAYTIETLSP